MLELNIKCESLEEARIYLNAQQYHNLLSDMAMAFRNVIKHGTEKDIIVQVNNFYPDLCKALDHHQGPY
jgi:hypothetical protein